MYNIENKSEAVQRIQRFIGENETGIYDNKTIKSVAEHQKLYNLPITGIVDYETFLSIISKYKKSLDTHHQQGSILFNPTFPYKPGDHSSNIGTINSILREIFKYYKLESKLPYGDYYNQDTILAVREIRNIFRFPQGDTIDTSLFNRMLIERAALQIKETFK